MFERRLKVFLMILFGMTGVLMLRAAHVQILQREEWREKAAETQKTVKSIPTVRGQIVDFKNRVIALDRPCIDACVDFRVLTSPPDAKYVKAMALERLRATQGDAYKNAARAKKAELLAQEVERVNADINAMWTRLSAVSRTPLEKVQEARDGIVRKVLLRRRAVWYRNYQLAVKKFEEREPAPAWRRWLVDESAEAPEQEDFTGITVAEELEDHAILKAVSNDVQNELRKHLEDYPGLVLRAGTERHYPYEDAACHLLGNLARVDRDDLKKDPNVGGDELRRYFPNDLIGRGGIESLAEPLLRGSRGRIVTIEGREKTDARLEPKPGNDVRVTLDIELQQDITKLFSSARVANELTKLYDTLPMHGGAVVIDLESSEVRAMVSFPTFNPNKYEEQFDKLNADHLDLPLLNRATQVAREPGSTVKPVVGLAGIAEGKIGVHDGIECDGFLRLDGRRIRPGRCWTESMFSGRGANLHQTPWNDPHLGQYGNAPGSLIFEEAVQRSCNVYFETLGDKMGMDGLSKWYSAFGLGRPTGLGIPEVKGLLPNAYDGPPDQRRFAVVISAIGQSWTLATPIQMANVSATIARDGIWMRPRLLTNGQNVPLPTTNPVPDRVDLRLPRAAVAAARQGMRDVVNTPAGSASKVAWPAGVVIAGKTGTAQAARLKVKVLDKDGKEIPDEKGRPKMRFLEPSSPINPNPQAPWYRGFGKEGTDLKHSWFIGFAPADNPKIAFAVMLEYGGSGGQGAGLIAKGIIEACVERQYLERTPKADADGAQPAAHVDEAELLEPHVGD